MSELIPYEVPDGPVFYIREEDQVAVRSTGVGWRKTTQEIKTGSSIWQVYDHIAGVQLHKEKVFLIGKGNSGYYRQERQEALERAVEWMDKQKE